MRAGAERQAWKYRWSSAAAHCGGTDAGRLLDLRPWSGAWTAQAWKEWLRRPESEEMVSALRSGIRSGRPLGSDSFVSKLEAALGRRVRPLPIGRPRKRIVEEARNR